MGNWASAPCARCVVIGLLLAIEREFKITIPNRGLMAAGSTFGALTDFALPLMDVNSHGQPG